MSSVSELLAFIPLDGTDAALLTNLLARIRPELPAIADRYIDLLRETPETAASVETPELIAQLRDRIVDWLEVGLRDPRNPELYGRRPWPQHRMVTFIHVVRMEYLRRVTRLCAPDETEATLAAVNRFLDLELAFLVRHDQMSHQESATERARELRDERLTSLQTLTAGLAHEIRNPLNAAKLQLELVERRLRRDDADDRLLTPVELAQAELERLTALMRDFLTFAQPVRLNPQAHDVVGLISGVCDQLREAAENRGATLRFAPDVPSLVTRIDGPKLTQVAEHLIRNAIDVTEAGGEIVVELTASESSLDLAVRDAGPGIPEAVRARIYEPFFSTKEGGTGMGMSIVHSLVTLHGGSIRLDTGPQGTRFGVSLPRG